MARRPAVTLAVLPAAGRANRAGQYLALENELRDTDNLVVLAKGVTKNGALWRAPSNGRFRRCERPGEVHDIVVFVEERSELSAGAIDELCKALADEHVAAVAPYANHAEGDELYIGIPYRPKELEKKAAFLEGFLERADRSLLRAKRLCGPCLAVRKTLLERVGGLDGFYRKGFDLSALADIAAADGELAIACGAYLHHPGGYSGIRHDGAGSKLISACLIVKDEQDNLKRCLDSIEDVVDEVVVYDTGSSDRTRELAASLGARVVSGYWDDDFARARNDALSQCAGEWILWLDADEAFVGEANVLRRELRSTRTEIEGFVVTIDNLRGNEAATTLSHPACRLFRRSSGHWDGKVHEQIVARAGNRELFIVASETFRITHWGYVQSAFSEKDKATRNLRTAFGDLGGGSALEFEDRLTSLARSYLLAGRFEEGIELTKRAIEIATRPVTERLARRALIEGLIGSGRAEEALSECRRLEAITAVPTLAHAHAGTALLLLGRYNEALDEFAQVVASTDDDGFSYEESFVAAGRAEALSALGRCDEAATLLLSTISKTGGLDTHLGRLIECLDRAGRELSEIPKAIGPQRLKAFVPQLLQLTPEVADRVFEVLFAAAPENLAVLAGAASLASRLPIARQLEWSARLRARGLTASCPLVQMTIATGVDATTRLLAAASAAAIFGDPRAEQALGAMALGVPLEAREEVVSALGSLYPAATERVRALLPARPVVARLSSTRRRRVLIVARGALELRAYALAARLSAHGHEVTLVQAQPAAPAEELLRRHGVTVHGYNPTSQWRSELAHVVCHLYAIAPIEVVVVAERAAPVLSRLCQLLPVAEILLESESDLLDEPVAMLNEDLELLYGEFEPVPKSVRRGLVLVGDLRADSRARVELDELAPILSGLGESAAFIGDDPDRLVQRGLPLAITLGPLADPTWWLRSARAVILLGSCAADPWRELAGRCGTPVLDATSDLPGLAVALKRLDDLGPSAELKAKANGGQGTERLHSDPLCSLPEPYRRAAHSGGRRVRLVGNVYGYESLATVNRELALCLSAVPGIELSVVTNESAPLPEDSVAQLGGVRVVAPADSAPADLEIRHQFPPDFSPSSSPLVLIQPWEFGGFPAEWVGPIRDVVDELWVPTSFVRECAIDSGIPPERVVVVANGVDTTRYSPEGPRRALKTNKSTRLLFVGGLIDRKGVDALLETYYTSFDADDDVCLVIKPFGSDGVYSHATLEPVVRRLVGGDGPEIEIVDDHLSAEEMAALYRACDVLVHPYRGEGFALPIAEAMSCGLPVVATNGGACLDFCDDTVGWLVDAYKRPLSFSDWTPSRAGNFWFEPSRRSLADALRQAVSDPAARRAKGLAGRKRIIEGFTWDMAASAAAARIEALQQRTVSCPRADLAVAT